MKMCLKKYYTLITQFTWKKDYCSCLLLMAAVSSGSTYLILSKGAPVYLVVHTLVEMQGGGSVVPKGSRVLASRLSMHVQHLVESAYWRVSGAAIVESGRVARCCFVIYRFVDFRIPEG